MHLRRNAGWSILVLKQKYGISIQQGRDEAIIKKNVASTEIKTY